MLSLHFLLICLYSLHFFCMNEKIHLDCDEIEIKDIELNRVMWKNDVRFWCVTVRVFLSGNFNFSINSPRTTKTWKWIYQHYEGPAQTVAAFKLIFIYVCNVYTLHMYEPLKHSGGVIADAMCHHALNICTRIKRTATKSIKTYRHIRTYNVCSCSLVRNRYMYKRTYTLAFGG